MPGPVLHVLVHRDKNGSMAPGRREMEEGVCLALALALASLFSWVCVYVQEQEAVRFLDYSAALCWHD